MRLRLSRLQKIIAEEITRAIKERDDKGTVTHYAWTYGEGVGNDEAKGIDESSDDTGDDDYQWDDEKLKFDLDVHELWNAPSLSIQGDTVTLETDEYDIEIPKKVFKAFAAKL